jgi:uncharacterized membrane protein YjjB (DUF3815 family)
MITIDNKFHMQSSAMAAVIAAAAVAHHAGGGQKIGKGADKVVLIPAILFIMVFSCL